MEGVRPKDVGKNQDEAIGIRREPGHERRITIQSAAKICLSLAQGDRGQVAVQDTRGHQADD